MAESAQRPVGLAARRIALALGLAAASCLGAPVRADEAAELLARQETSDREYRRVLEAITLTEERVGAIAADIALLRKDNATVTAALIQAAKTEKKLGEDIGEIAGRLDALRGREAGIRASLDARRGVLAEVLGALQRMGLNPPPAILVRPEDALSSVRSAILLGAVVPELRAETETLATDLAELARVMASIDAERGRLETTVGEQVAEQRRLSLLLEEKRRLQAQSEAVLAVEREKAEELARQAGTLKELIDSLESEIGSVRAAAEAARQAEAERRTREEESAALAVPEGNRLVEPLAFSALRGQLALPVAGVRARGFGDEDGNGGVMLGDMVKTQSGAIVTAPSGGDVLYAGPFRSYGQLLILNAGDGYHVVLAGMGRISVAPGQAVLAGEPVGAMGEARVAGPVSLPDGHAGPELYVEFRKDGKPVDPSPWWAERISGRTGNDT